MHVIVNADADVPTATAEDSVGLEDNPIDLDLSASLTDIDGSESLSLTIQGVPDGAILSAGTDNGDGSWSLAPGQLTSLTITPPVNFEGDIPLTLVATSTEADGGDFETTEVPFTVTVEPDLSKPDFEVTAAEGYEDNAIALDIDPGTVDVVTIGNVPTGAVLSAGTDNGDGTWTVDAGDLAGITITPPQDSDEEFTLSVTGTDVTGITQTLDVPVTVHAVADRPNLDVTSSIGDEDTSIPLTISSNLTDTDGSETLSLSIDIIGIPEGAKLTYVDDQGDPQEITVTDNSASLTQNQLNGLSITPPQDYYGDITLQVTSTSTETADDASPASAATTATFGVTVRPVNDDPEVTVTSLDENGDPILDDEGNPQFAGNEDETISLNISAEMPDPTTVELSSVLLGGIEPGSTLTYVDDQGATQSINYTGSVAQLSEAQLNGLSITPPPDFNGEMDMTATAFSEDGGVVVTPFSVDVAAIADLDIDTTTSNDVEGGETTATVSGVEDTAIDLNISAASDEAITISSVPDGAELSAGTDNGNGTWTLTAADLEGLTITPPGDSDTDFDITVTAQSPDGQELTGTISVSVAADAPSLDLAAASGSEDTAIPLSIDAEVTDSSETLSISISDIPDGATLTYVDDAGATQTITVAGGSVDLTADQLNGLSITPPADSNEDFQLSVSATTTDGTDTETVTSALDVSVTGDADAPTATVQDETGTEDTWIQLNLDSALSDTETTSNSFNVTVEGDADAPTVTVSDASGTEDTAIPLSIDAALTDTSETLSITIGDIPQGATLTYVDGSNDTQTITVENSSADLTADQLNGLQITPPTDSNEDFQLSVSATSTDGTDTATTTSTLDVSVTGDADAPTLSAELGDPTVTTSGGTETDVTISADNYSSTDSGFTVTARSIDGDGNLTDASVDNVSTGGGGFGVSGAASGPDYQLGYDQDAEISEQLIITFDNDVSDASFDFARLYADEGGEGANEQGHYELYLDGVKVGEGDFDTDNGNTGSVSISAADGGGFDQIVFTAADGYSVSGSGDGSDYVVTGVEFTQIEGGETTVTYPLDITSSLTDTDGSETLSITVSDLPDGATLSAGTENQDGSWTLTPAELDDLEVTLTGDDSGQSFDLTVAATATENDGDTETVSVTASSDGTNTDLTSDGATLDVTDATGTEDTAIALDIDAGLIDTDGSETLSITIGDVPDGATLSAGTDNEDGTWTLSADDLDGLMITPPADSDVDFTLSVTATATESSTGDTSTTTGTLDVSVAADADTPTLSLSDAAGAEDNAIALNINPGLTDLDGSESLSITIADIPDGSMLFSIDNNEVQQITVTNGSAELTPHQLTGLQIVPPEDYSGSFNLSVTATATEAEGGDTASTSGTMTVDVSGVADTPTLDLTAASGTEDNAIPLSITADTTDGSETLSVSIADIPYGATMTYVDGDGATQTISVTNGTAELTPDQLNGLAITPPEDSDVDFDLSVTATSTDGTDTATNSGSLSVSVAADADAPTLVFTDASDAEDNAIALDIDTGLTDVDGSEALSITIGDIPAGSTLTYVDDQGATQTITVSEGSADLTYEQLNDLQITPPEDYSGSFDLSVTATATATEADGGDTATTTGTLTVDVAAVADEADLTVHDASGVEDTAISLNITAETTDDSETLSVSIADIPAGATLTYVDDQGATQEITVTNGSADLTPDQLNGLSITPAADSNEDFQLSVSATTTDGADTETVTSTLDVSVTGDADAPTLDASVGDGEIVTIGGDPVDVTIGVDNVTETGGGFSVTARSLDDNGELSEASADNIAFNENPPGFGVAGGASGADSELGYDSGSGTSEELIVNFNEDVSTADVTFAWLNPNEDAVYEIYRDGVKVGEGLVDGGNDGVDPMVSVSADDGGSFDQIVFTAPGQGDDFLINSIEFEANEGGDTVVQYPLDITSALTDTDGSETLSITISDLPEDATLSAGTENTDGSWTLAAGDLQGLTMTVAGDNPGQSFDLTVAATATENDGDTETVSVTASSDGTNVDIAADGATLDVTDATGTEDTAIALDIDAGLIDTDGSETLSITISDVPAGATLNAGTDNEDGTWTLSADNLDGLMITPPADSDVDFTLSVTATATETSTGDTSTTTGTLDVSVAADADTPTLDLTDAMGSEDRAIALDIDPGLGDTDGSESLSITVGDIPAGSTLTYVDGDGATQSITVTNGSADLTADQLSGLQITPPEDYSGSFDLSVTATATEADDGDTATTSGTLTVDVAAVADEADLTVSDASGLEDTAIPLSIDAEVTDSSETLSISISDIPDGATLTYVDDAGATQTITVAGGSVDLTADQLNGLSITPPADSNEDFQLSVSATTTDGTDTETVTSALDVSVTGDADAPTATVQDETGTEDTWIQLNLDSALSDTDGSESLTITITDVPDGALLAPGTDNGDGTWSVTPAELPQVCILPPDDFSGEITMTLNVTATENDGDTETTSNSFNVTVEGDADAPTVTVSDASGTEDTAIPLSIDAALTDTSETLSITIGDIPQGTTLTYVDGSNDTQTITVENGSADLTPAQLNGLQITPPTDSNEDFQLSVSATSADGTDTATTTSTLDVSVTGDADAPTLDVSIDDGTYSSGGTPESDPVTVDIANDGALTFSGASSYGEIAYSTGEIEISADDSGTFNLQSLDLGKWGGDGIVVKAYDENGNEITSQSISMGDSYGIGGTVDFSDVSGFDGVHSIGISNPGGYIKVGDVTTTTGDADGGDAVTTYDLDVTTALTDTDGSETLSVTINDVPDGVSLSAGTDNGDGTWSVDPADLDGLEMTVPEGTEDFSVTVSATATENDGDTETTTQTIDVGSLDTVAETPTVSVDNAAGLEDGDIPITINAALIDTDGSETLSVTIGDVPDGATLSAGTDNGDGTWTIDPADLDGLSVTPPADSDADFTLSVSVTATETLSGDTSTVTASLDVSVEAVADAPTLETADASGTEDNAIALKISSGLTDTDGSETLSITISGVPDGATLNAGTENQDGTWTLSSDDLNGLTVTPPADSDVDFTLTVSATSTDGTDTETVSGTIDVSVAADADTPTLNLEQASGDEDNAIALNIDPGLGDTDGSETMSITISGVPDGAILSAGTANADGTWILDGADLSDLTITPPPDYSGSFDLGVTATATEADGGDTATASGTITVDVAGVADEADLTVSDATGTEDQSISLNIDAGDGDDTVMGGSGDDIIDGGDGADLIDAGTGADTIDGGAGDDHVMGGDGDDLFIFGSGDGADYFNGGDGWSDTVQLEGVDSGPGGDSGWTLQVDEGTTYTETESGVEFDAEASGSIVLADGSELTFDNVEKLEW